MKITSGSNIKTTFKRFFRNFSLHPLLFKKFKDIINNIHFDNVIGVKFMQGEEITYDIQTRKANVFSRKTNE